MRKQMLRQLHCCSSLIFSSQEDFFERGSLETKSYYKKLEKGFADKNSQSRLIHDILFNLSSSLYSWWISSGKFRF